MRQLTEKVTIVCQGLQAQGSAATASYVCIKDVCEANLQHAALHTKSARLTSSFPLSTTSPVGELLP